MSQDRAFEKYLEGKTDLSTLYADLPEVKLPDHLDAAILAEAHRAVGSRPGAKPKRRWAIPLSMVATLFVAVMVAMQLPYMLKDADQVQQLKEESMAALMDKSTAEPAAPAPVETRNSQLTGQLLAKSKSDSALGAPTPMAAEAEAPAPARANAPARAAKRMELRERAERDTGEEFSKEKKSAGHTAGDVSDAYELRAPAARMAVPAPAQLERPLKDEASAANLRPQEWLDRIKKLQQQGKLEDAKKELAAFKKRYPDYPVPAALELL